MSYLYGDSSPSALKTNFIDFLKDALDYSVQVLSADRRIREGGEHGVALRREGDAEVARLEALGAQIARAVDGMALGDTESATARCASSILSSSAALVNGEIDRARANVTSELARIDTQGTAERERCLQALGALLVRHDLPDWIAEVRLEQQGGTRYAAWLTAHADFGLEATLELEIPPAHLLAHPVRVDKLFERLEVHAPEEGGWIRKEVKLRPQRLEKEYVTELAVGRDATILKLRANADGTGGGFDLSVRPEAPRVSLLRAGEAGAAPFELADADAARVVELAEKLVAACADLRQSRKRLTDAKLDGKPLAEQPEPRAVVERLIETITPTVQEIARRSLTQAELVLKRQLDGGRREEIFVSRDELKHKLDPLADEERALFAPLGLADEPSASRPRRPTLPGITPASAVVAGAPPLSLIAAPPPVAAPSSSAATGEAAVASPAAPSSAASLPSRVRRPTPTPVAPISAAADDSEIILEAPIPSAGNTPAPPPSKQR